MSDNLAIDAVTLYLALDHDTIKILNMESNVLDSISMVHKMLPHDKTFL